MSMHIFNNIKSLFNKNKALMLLCFVLSICISACSNDENIVNTNVQTINDPVSFEIKGIDGQLLDNVNLALSSMGSISYQKLKYYRYDILNNVKKAMRAYGYYDPSIKLESKIGKYPTGDKYIVSLQIDPKKAVFIRYFNVEILGEGQSYEVFDKLVKASGLGKYQVLDHALYENLKKNLMDKAISLGFFDAKYISHRILVYKDENFADIELILDTNKRYKYGPIIADDKTKELLKPAIGLFNLNEGKNFSADDINAYIQSLSETNFYKSIDVKPVVDKSDESLHVPLSINLSKKSNNIMGVGLGYSTDEGVRLLLDWTKPLLNSYGHSLQTYARVSTVSQDAQVVYKIPRKNVNLDYYYIQAGQKHTDLNDTISDRSQLSFHYVANDTGRWRRDYSIRAEYEDYTQGYERGHGLNIMPVLQLSRRESSGGYDPKSGYYLYAEFSGASKAFSDYSFTRVYLMSKFLMSPTENTRLILRGEYGVNMGEDSGRLPPSLRFFVGGDNSLRGFAYQSKAPMLNGKLKGGKSMAVGSVEYQFPIGISNSRLALFVDAGMATDDYSDPILYAPGIGYRYLSAYGIFKVDLACGIEPDNKTIKLHVTFGPEF